MKFSGAIKDKNIGALTIAHLSLVDSKAKIAYPFSAISRFYAEPRHWRVVTNVSPADLVFENLQALPRVWIAQTTIPMSETLQLKAIHFGQAERDQVAIDWAKVALSNNFLNNPAITSKRDGIASLKSLTANREVVETRCHDECLLVMSDLWYPGWKASIDSVDTNLVRADYFLRGMRVPGGTHKIVVWFAPNILIAGISLSVLSVFALLYVSFRAMVEAASGISE